MCIFDKRKTLKMREELLNQNYYLDVESPDFDGETSCVKSYYKDLDTENFYIQIEVDVEFKHCTLEWCEVVNVWLTEITVTDDNGINLHVSDALHKEIESKIEINYI